VTLDNYYVNGEISVLGHSFTTWLRQPLSDGWATLLTRRVGRLSVWDRSGRNFAAALSLGHLDDKKVDYRIYGENYFCLLVAYEYWSILLARNKYTCRSFTIRLASAADLIEEIQFYQLARLITVSKHS